MADTFGSLVNLNAYTLEEVDGLIHIGTSGHICIKSMR